jgi:uncharacterized protein YxjI
VLRRPRSEPGPQPGPAAPVAERGAERYKLRERLWSIGDDYWIETAGGRRAFYVDGKALRLRDTLILKDAQGRELYRIQGKPVRVKETMSIDRDGQAVATVKKAMVAPLRERMSVDVAGRGDIDIQGNITDHEYTMERGGRRVAEVSKRWLRLADTYGVEVAPTEDDALVLAIAAVIDQMTHE